MTSEINPSHPFTNSQPVTRGQFLAILRAAVSNAEYSFARQSALQWLAAFPGDMQVSQLYAESLAGENRLAEARTIVKGLSLADPENVDAIRLWLKMEEVIDLSSASKSVSEETSSQAVSEQVRLVQNLESWIIALEPELSTPARASGKAPGMWGKALADIQKNLQAENYEQAQADLLEILTIDTSSPLPAVVHLKLLLADPNAPLAARRSLAEHYHKRWPDCLACTLLLASWLLQEGAVERAVALMHQAAGRDVSGSIATRLFGQDHPYRSLWPEMPALDLDLVIPATVAKTLGWNLLSSGEQAQPSPEAAASVAAAIGMVTSDAAKNPESKDLDGIAIAGGVALVMADLNEKDSSVEEVVRFRETLDKMAAGLDQLPASQFDGRFPVYVILSLQGNLEAKYSPEGANKIIAEMQRLAQAIPQRQAAVKRGRWGAIAFLPDRSESAGALGLTLLKAFDPWSIKLALADLDQALGKHGEMIGALLIVGGPEIIPFHNLPNPVDDPDSEIPSDNPYATRDENYFIPEWPVGRLPGDASTDPDILVQSLSNIRQVNGSRTGEKSRGGWLAWISGWFSPTRRPAKKGFGYTAAIWRNASFHVYKPVGEAKTVLVCPPHPTVRSNNGTNHNGHKAATLPPARLGYFNLHGLSDSAEWYGQRDPLEASEGPDYPVAVRPEDVQALGSKTPLVVFSEACYGAHILGKSTDQALALQFLQSGTSVVVGSTGMSYGAINAPLIAADLLGYAFWKGLLDGLSAGEALQRAKIQLASEMHQRQGYLDGEDQKTLISFVLYGDPLMRLTKDVRASKSIRRLAGHPPPVKTVCDRVLDGESAEQVPAEILSYVKQAVATYLPGMSDARAYYAAERPTCLAHDHTCPTNQLNGKARPRNLPERRLVVLSKTFEKAGKSHPQFARLTLDAKGKLVKIVVSR